MTGRNYPAIRHDPSRSVTPFATRYGSGILDMGGRNHFPSEVLVLSDKRPYRNLTFHNVLARQGSSYCNRARLNFQAFVLRDMKIAT